MKRVILFICACALLLPATPVSAEISNPYVVDEKSQALFGDSAEIMSASSTYQGLENYVHNYINNYLHITFTYTHNQCCTAAYPPSFYVTNLDPTATTTLTVRDHYYVFALSSQPTHLSGLYLYEVQFDATGYTAVVTASSTEVTHFHRDITGLTTTDYAALANDYPRQDPVGAYSMSFTPLPIYEAPAPPAPIATTTPVIIVPGIMGSYLNKNDGSNDEVWMDLLKMAFPGSDSYLDDLNLSADGTSPVPLIATDIIRKVNIPLFSRDMFEGLIENTETNNYNENEDLFVFPYDWRLDLKTIASNLKNKIDEIKVERGVDKVDLVAHSMGGLLVKQYLKDYGGDSVDKFVDVGTPHNGASKSFITLMYGDTDIGILNKETIKSISQNMSSLYELLPSRNYFTSEEYYVLDGTSGNNRLDFSETKDYLKSEGRNSALVDRAEAFHQEIDGLDPATYGVDTYNIVGCGTPTIGKFYLLQSGEHPIYNIGYVNGDGTVPLVSAEALPAEKTYYLREAKHALMPSASGVKEIVVDIITATSSANLDISPYSNLATSASGCTLPNGRIVSFHSPIDLHIYDNSGNHVGPDANGDIESEILGVTYDIIGDNKFAFLPDGTDYTVKGSATAEGTFDLRIQEVANEEVATTTIFSDVAITPISQLEFSINSDTPTQVTLDRDNDGAFESLVNISTTTSGVLESTGKTSATTITPAQLASARSRGNSKVPPLAAASSTIFKTDTKVLPPPFATTSIPSQKPPKTLQASKVSEAPIATSTNSAIVYKSVPSKLKLILKSVWGWIKSKI